MRRFALMSLLASLIPAGMAAQDDMYFVPSEDDDVSSTVERITPYRATYYSGSDRDVDEYNRHPSSEIQYIDSLGNEIDDVIDFDAVVGIYPDSAADEGCDYVGDYECTRQMSRFDDYDWEDAYLDGYYDGLTDDYYWYDPWYYDWYLSYYWPWGYWGWYYPYYWGGWYYGSWHHGWHYAWGGHRYYGGGYWGGRYGHRATASHSRGTGRRPLSGYSSTTSSSRYGGTRSSSYGSSRSSRSSSYSSSRSGGSRSSYGSSFGGSRSSFSGGSRGGGFSGGGSRGGGGGGRR